MGKFCQILTELPARDTPIFSFWDDNLCKHQWIFTKFGMCIDIVLLFGIASGQISSNFDADICLSFLGDNLSKYQGILTKLIHALILRRFG